MVKNVIGEKERKGLLSRSNYTEKISKYLKQKNVLFIVGPKEVGKTSILKSYNEDSIYFDLSTISISPERFAVEYIAQICYSHFGGSPLDVQKFKDIEYLQTLDLDYSTKKLLAVIENELQKIKPNQELLLRSALNFPKTFFESTGKEFVFILDNFEHFLGFKNFLALSKCISIFFEEIAVQKIKYLLSSSVSTMMLKALEGKVEHYAIELFTIEETKWLVKSVLGTADDRLVKEVQKLTGGIPLLIDALCKRYGDSNYDKKSLEKAFVNELLDKDSPTYHHFETLLSESLNRARGASLLKTIMHVLAYEDELRLTEVARLIYKSGPVTKSLLERLMEVDLVKKEKAFFSFNDKQLKQWCALRFANIVFSEDNVDLSVLK